MYGWFHDERRIIYILEYVPNGNLFDKLQNGPFDNVEAATVIFPLELKPKIFFQLFILYSFLVYLSNSKRADLYSFKKYSTQRS
jgi:hypothetical protein